MSHAAHTYQWGVSPETLKAKIDKIAEGNLRGRCSVIKMRLLILRARKSALRNAPEDRSSA